jgi:Fe2+ or Zn2+ uptake regulation protein
MSEVAVTPHLYPVNNPSQKQSTRRLMQSDDNEPNTNKSTGFVCLYRSIKDHWLWSSPKWLQQFIDLVLEANYKNQKVLIGATLIECKRGQSIKSLSTWAKQWKINKSAVRRFLKLLEKDGMITLENVSKTTRITICNYDTYNGARIEDETIVKRSCNDTETLATPNNKANKENNGNNNSEPVPLFDLKAQYKSLNATKDDLREFISQNRPDFIEPYVAYWNLYAKDHGLSAVRKITRERETHFKSRIREKEFNYLAILDRAGRSSFLLSKAWFSLAWVIKDSEKYINILEGKYDDDKAPKEATIQSSVNDLLKSVNN